MTPTPDPKPLAQLIDTSTELEKIVGEIEDGLAHYAAALKGEGHLGTAYMMAVNCSPDELRALIDGLKAAEARADEAELQRDAAYGGIQTEHDAAIERDADLRSKLAAAERERDEWEQAAQKEFRWTHVETVDEMQSFFRSRLQAIRDAARPLGYAIAAHGSERRDFDLIAVPWVDDPASPDLIAAAVHYAACKLRHSQYRWEKKPNGRIAVSIPICWTGDGIPDALSLGCIDLSVVISESTLAASREEARRLREALEPFARLAEKFNDFEESATVWLGVTTDIAATTVAVFRRALTAAKQDGPTTENLVALKEKRFL